VANQFKTFTAGSVLTASEVNSYLMKQTVIVCDSSADYPSSPNEGMFVYDKALDAFLQYTTSTTTWRPPWNLPWGRVASATGSATTNIGTTYVDLSGMSVSWTAVQNRRYRVKVQANILAPASGTSDCNVFLRIVDAGAVQKAESTQTAALTLSYTEFTLVELLDYTSAGASISRRAQAKVSASSNNSLVTTNPPLIMVEDIGPAAAPA
jgi:hypothetical protein